MICIVKKLFILLVGLLSPLVVVQPVFAAAIEICPTTGPFAKLCNLKFDNVGTIIGNLITIILILAIVIAVFFLIYGGIRWITSGGDKQAVENARNHIIAAIVGLVIALLAFFIINFVGSLIGVNLTNLTIPTLVP